MQYVVESIFTDAGRGEEKSMTELPSPGDLRRIADDEETRKMQELLEKKRKTGRTSRSCTPRS
jgi:hypothetical protein